MNVKKVFKYIISIVFTILFVCSVTAAVRFSISARHFRELSERYRNELDTAVNTNTELGKQLAESRRVITDCRSATAAITDAANRNITTARGAIELVREIREKVVLLENRLSDSNDISNSDSGDSIDSEVDE